MSLVAKREFIIMKFFNLPCCTAMRLALCSGGDVQNRSLLNKLKCGRPVDYVLYPHVASNGLITARPPLLSTWV